MSGSDCSEVKALNDEEYRQEQEYRDWYFRKETGWFVMFALLGVGSLQAHGSLAHTLYILTLLWIVYGLWWARKTRDPGYREEHDPEAAAVRLQTYFYLVNLKGCGPRSAERILTKVDAGEKLTEWEQQFWKEVN